MEQTNPVVYMEDVDAIAVKAHDLVESELTRLGITMTDEQSSTLWAGLQLDIETICGCPDYRSLT